VGSVDTFTFVELRLAGGAPVSFGVVVVVVIPGSCARAPEWA